MEDKKIFAVTGLFDTPDGIIHAAEKISSNGYKRYDINTPYPVHGMDRAMKLSHSKLGYFALAFGLSGIAIAVLFMYWVTNFDYPLVIGGKPFFSLPAFIPIIFEITVLLASVGTVLTMLFLLFRLPNNAHPLHDTHYMKSVSVDKFGVCIEATDKLFDAEKIKKFLSELGSSKIEEIYYDNSFLKNNYRVFSKKFVGFLVVTFLMVSGITYYALNIMMFQPPFTWMMIQHRGNSQSPSTFFANGATMREPVAGTVTRGFMPYQFAGDPEGAGANLVNPLVPAKEVLEKGKARFLSYCSPCHGNYAQGNSRMNNQFPNPPTLHSDKVRNWPDGRIYHVITEGQNLMPSYAKQILREDRWAIILYIRSLQRALNAKEEDVK